MLLVLMDQQNVMLNLSSDLSELLNLSVFLMVDKESVLTHMYILTLIPVEEESGQLQAASWPSILLMG